MIAGPMLRGSSLLISSAWEGGADGAGEGGPGGDEEPGVVMIGPAVPPGTAVAPRSGVAGVEMKTRTTAATARRVVKVRPSRPRAIPLP